MQQSNDTRFLIKEEGNTYSKTANQSKWLNEHILINKNEMKNSHTYSITISDKEEYYVTFLRTSLSLSMTFHCHC